MKKILILIFLYVSQHFLFAQVRKNVLLNDNWRFVYGYEVSSKAGRIVQLPHTWNKEDVLMGKLDYYRGQGSYEKEILIDESWKNKRLFLKFDGVNTLANLFINGIHVGEHRGGYTAFLFEITDYVNYGKENKFQVRVSNALQLDIMPLVGDFNFYGGIYRDVNLIITEKSCISPLNYASSGVYLEQKNVSKEKADVNTKVLISNRTDISQEYNLSIDLIDSDKTILSLSKNLIVEKNNQIMAEIPFSLIKPRLWNGRKDPFMYKVVVSLKQDNKIIDQIEQPLGLRYFNVDSKQGFYLNGEHLQLRGVCRHQDRSGQGYALLAKDNEEDISILVEMGANAVRLSHYPQAPYIYDLLDKNGIIAWSEIPFVGPGGYRDQGFINQLSFRENGKQQLKEMIRQNYNHPSVCFWGLFNELKFDEECPVEYIRELNAIAKLEDSTRLTTSASFIDKAEINEITDLIGWNKYFGWYAGNPEDIGAWVDSIHRQTPNLKISISEYGAGASIFHHQEELVKTKSSSDWHPEAWQAYYHEKNWKEINKRPFIWGSFIWNLFDFSAVHRNEGDNKGINDKGLVTFDRKIKKDAWWFYKATWNKEDPVLYITNRRFIKRKSEITSVKVYSNQEKAELFVNGISCGKKTVHEAVVQWDKIKLKTGVNLIEVKTKKGQQNLYDSCVWELE